MKLNRLSALPFVRCGAVLAGTLTISACATGGNVVSTLLVPDDTPRGRPSGGYDRMVITCAYALSADSLFVGRVVRRMPDGELIPLLGVVVLLETHGTAHATRTATPISIEQDRNGRFSHEVMLWSDSIVYYKENVPVGWEEIEDTATFTVQAPGCEPLRVELSDPGIEKTLEMRCVGEG